MFEVKFSSLSSVSERQKQFLREAERDRLVEEVRQKSEKSGLRQQVGSSLVRLGQRLLGEPQLA